MAAPRRKLRLSEDTADLIRRAHPDLKRRLRRALDAVAREPTSGKPLREELLGLRSFRVGKTRIIYTLADTGDIEIVAIGPRKRVYEETWRLLRRESEESGRP